MQNERRKGLESQKTKENPWLVEARANHVYSYIQGWREKNRWNVEATTCLPLGNLLVDDTSSRDTEQTRIIRCLDSE
jgi:hypothetical protein